MGRGKDQMRYAAFGPGELEAELLRAFAATPRRPPARPPLSRTSIVVVRKEVLPFYYAVYDHALHRFVELQYRAGRDAVLHALPVPPDGQPPTAPD